ncbi:MAG: hypothetical protein ABI596_13055 [Pyrinomonadaceae bacterium]
MGTNKSRSVRKTPLTVGLFLSVLAAGSGIASRASSQEPVLAVPDDPTKIYYTDAQNRLAPLPFESSITPLDPFVFAKSDRIGRAELKGLNAATTLTVSDPRFYVFVADRMDPPPHQLVRLTGKNGNRRFTVVSTRGRKGYSPMAAESIELKYRILERLRVAAGKGRTLFINYLEIRPRHSLPPGEYAIIGDSLQDIATFRIK